MEKFLKAFFWKEHPAQGALFALFLILCYQCVAYPLLHLLEFLSPLKLLQATIYLPLWLLMLYCYFLFIQFYYLLIRELYPRFPRWLAFLWSLCACSFISLPILTILLPAAWRRWKFTGPTILMLLLGIFAIPFELITKVLPSPESFGFLYQFLSAGALFTAVILLFPAAGKRKLIYVPLLLFCLLNGGSVLLDIHYSRQAQKELAAFLEEIDGTPERLRNWNAAADLEHSRDGDFPRDTELASLPHAGWISSESTEEEYAQALKIANDFSPVVSHLEALESLRIHLPESPNDKLYFDTPGGEFFINCFRYFHNRAEIAARTGDRALLLDSMRKMCVLRDRAGENWGVYYGQIAAELEHSILFTIDDLRRHPVFTREDAELYREQSRKNADKWIPLAARKYRESLLRNVHAFQVQVKDNSAFWKPWVKWSAKENSWQWREMNPYEADCNLAFYRSLKQLEFRYLLQSCRALLDIVDQYETSPEKAREAHEALHASLTPRWSFAYTLLADDLKPEKMDAFLEIAKKSR